MSTNPIAQFSKKNISGAIEACLNNGDRILEETYDIEFRDPPSTRFFLIAIAQEEIAKAFILFLIGEEIIPLSIGVRRAINDHACKHLVGMIMDYMIMHWDSEEELHAQFDIDFDAGNFLPNGVGSALEILGYEKIGRWTRNNWGWVDDPNYDPEVVKIAEGKKDRRKQDALYVRIGKNGQVASTPSVITKSEMTEEWERAGRYMHFMLAITGQRSHGFSERRYERVIEALKTIFSSHINSGDQAKP